MMGDAKRWAERRAQVRRPQQDQGKDVAGAWEQKGPGNTVVNQRRSQGISASMGVGDSECTQGVAKEDEGWGMLRGGWLSLLMR